MLKKVLIVGAVLIVVLGGVITMQPSTYHVERSIAIAAPADVVYSYADDLKKQNQWSPWAKKDPNIKSTFTGAGHGVGAGSAWDSDQPGVGAGEMTITESKPSHVIYAIEFFKPFADKGTSTVGMEAHADKVTVTWAMDGNMSFFSKAMCLVTSMDKLLGPDFEAGLQDLKTLAEAGQHLEDVARKAAADVGTGVIPPADEPPVVPQPMAPPPP